MAYQNGCEAYQGQNGCDEAPFVKRYTCKTDTMKDMQSLWKNGLLVDYTLITADKTQHPAHRCHLACFSEYFRAMLTGSMKESSADKVELPVVTANGLKPILEFIYGECLQVDQDNIEDIVSAASYLQIPSVLDNCNHYLRNTIHLKTCLKYSELLESHGTTLEQSLRKDIDEFIRKNVSEIVRAGHHLDLPCESFKVYLDSDLGIEWCGQEFEVYQSAMKWLNAKPGREKHRLELMELVRFPLMTTGQLRGLLAKKNPMASDPDVRKLITTAMEYASASISQKLAKQSPRTQPRGPPRLVVITECKSLYALKEDSAGKRYSWMKFPDVPLQLNRAASVASHSGFLFVVGGWKNDKEASKTCHVFDSRTLSWFTLSDMNKGRVTFPLVSCGEKMYAVGGQTARHSLGMRTLNECEASIERYDPVTKTWVIEALMECPVRQHTAASVNKVIYIYGGITSSEARLNKFHSYDPATQTWTDLRAHTHPDFRQRFLIMVNIRNKLHFFNPHAQRVGCFNVQIGRWSSFETSSKMSSWKKLAHAQPKVYFINDLGDHGEFEAVVFDGSQFPRVTTLPQHPEKLCRSLFCTIPIENRDMMSQSQVQVQKIPIAMTSQ